MTEIQPCPFCGEDDPCVDEVEISVYALCCNGCGMIGPHQDDDGVADTPGKATEMWNARKVMA